jgi:hypothetical protein
VNPLRAGLRRLLRGPVVSRLLGRCGIDARRFWLLMDLFDQLADHQELMSDLGRDRAGLRAPALVFAAVTAMLSLFLLAAALPLREYLWTFLILTTLLLLLLLISETANSLVNPVEGLVLAHQPIDGATYTAAKLAHLGRILLHLGAAFALGTLVALLCCATFGWLVRIVPAQRLKAASHFVQLAPLVAIFGWRPLQHFFSRLDWSAFAAHHPAASAAVSVALVLLALAAVVFGLRSLSADYLIRVSAIVHSSAARRATPRHLGHARLWLPGGPAGRAGYFFVSQMMRRDWHFRRQLLAFLPALVVALGGSIANLRTTPFAGRFTSTHFIPHLLGAMLALICSLLVYSNDYRGAWIFLNAPARAFAGYARGVHALFWLWFVALPHALLLAVTVWLWGPLDALLFTLFSAAAASLYLALDLLLIDGLPFTRPAESQSTSMTFLLMSVGGLVVALAVALQYYFLFHSRLAVLAATLAAALLALWLTRRSLASFTATMRFRVGLQTQETGSLYHEIAS